MAFCPGCGSQVADNAAVCPACGKALAQAGAGGTATAPAAAPASSGLADNVAGLLAYLFIPAIIFLIVEPFNKNKFVKFHSWQSISLGIVSIVGHIVLTMIPIIGWFLLPLFSLAILIIAIVCMIKAYQNQWFKLPGIGGFAEKQANQ